MKNLRSIFIVIVGFALTLGACKKDDTVTYWYSNGIYIESDLSKAGYVVDLDNGKRLIPTQGSYSISEMPNENKVLISYSIVSETSSEINANVVGMNKILTKGILQLTEENKDSIGNDALVVYSDEVWLSKYHLNVVFNYYQYGGLHFINLVKPIGEQFDAEGNQILELRHNANNDYLINNATGIVAFDMRSLYQEGMDSLNFVFRSMDYDSVEFSWKGTYHFDNNTSTKNAFVGTPPFYTEVK